MTAGQGTAPVIAIDGPSASGKGTVAERVAAALGLHYLDSGALYRLVALACLDAGADPNDGAAASAVAGTLSVSFRGTEPLVAGEPVGDRIRTEAVSSAASRVAQHAPVRAALFDLQRGFRRPPGLVADGRDMGTVVFPDAELKVFLTASPEARAERRHKQLITKGLGATMAALLRDIRERDARDTQRAAAPLRQAPDAVLIDTTPLDVDEVVARVLRLWADRARCPMSPA